MGCYEISLGDTIGVGEPDHVRRLIDAVGKQIQRSQLAMHFHDTYGRAVENVRASLEEGISVFDRLGGGPGRLPVCSRRAWECGD